VASFLSEYTVTIGFGVTTFHNPYYTTTLQLQEATTKINKIK
jgi:hypothetical protein